MRSRGSSPDLRALKTGLEKQKKNNRKIVHSSVHNFKTAEVDKAKFFCCFVVLTLLVDCRLVSGVAAVALSVHTQGNAAGV